MKTTPVTPGMFCWHELVTTRTQEAAAFYKEMLGGEVAEFPAAGGQYAVLTVDGAAVAGFQPANASHPTDVPSQWLAYVAVADVDATCAKVIAAGGSVATAPHDSPMGRGAFIRDPQGARIGLFCAKPGATDGTNPCGPGAPCWMELLTSDVPAAAAFYATVLGWNIVEQVFPFGTVHVAQAGPTHVCSLFPRPANDRLTHNRWYPYFQVASVDQAHKRVRALGGMEASAVMPLPSIGRWFPAADAVGAEVAFMEFEERG